MDNELIEPKRRAGLHAPLPNQKIEEVLSEEDPRSRAAKRAAELREHRGSQLEGQDSFAIDPRIIPDGWSYEWKVLTVLGATNRSYDIHVRQGGWEPVPASRHPELMPRGWTGATIERDGLMLMERPLEITEEAKVREIIKARNQVKDKEDQIQNSPAGMNSLCPPDNKGKPISVGIRKTYEPLTIPQ